MRRLRYALPLLLLFYSFMTQWNGDVKKHSFTTQSACNTARNWVAAWGIPASGCFLEQ